LTGSHDGYGNCSSYHGSPFWRCVCGGASTGYEETSEQLTGYLFTLTRTAQFKHTELVLRVCVCVCVVCVLCAASLTDFLSCVSPKLMKAKSLIGSECLQPHLMGLLWRPPAVSGRTRSFLNPPTRPLPCFLWAGYGRGLLELTQTHSQ